METIVSYSLLVQLVVMKSNTQMTNFNNLAEHALRNEGKCLVELGACLQRPHIGMKLIVPKVMKEAISFEGKGSIK